MSFLDMAAFFLSDLFGPFLPFFLDLPSSADRPWNEGFSGFFLFFFGWEIFLTPFACFGFPLAPFGRPFFPAGDLC